jgi:hypothetical protein
MESYPHLKPGLLVCDQDNRERVGILLPTRRYSVARGCRLVHFPDKREHVLACRLVVIGKASQVDYLAARNWKGITP